MTHFYLVTDLIEEISEILKDIKTKNVTGEEITGVKGYEQCLPIIKDDEDDADKFFPYFIVRIQEGVTPDDTEPWEDTVSILFGIHDDDVQTNGHRHILTMIQRVTDRFAKEPLLKNKYRASEKMQWALQEEDTYPYYFGGVELKFRVPKIGRSDGWS